MEKFLILERFGARLRKNNRHLIEPSDSLAVALGLAIFKGGRTFR